MTPSDLPAIPDTLPAFEAALLSHDWRYLVETLEDGSYEIQLDIDGDRGIHHLNIILFGCCGEVIVYAHHPIKSSSESLVQMALLLLRLNHRSQVGAWDLDVDGGGIAYRVGLDRTNVTLDSSGADGMIVEALCACEHDFIPVAKVALGVLSAEEAWVERLLTRAGAHHQEP